MLIISKRRFLPILTFLALSLYCLYIYLPNKLANIISSKNTLEKVNQLYRKEFDSVVTQYCNSSSNQVNASLCLNQLEQLDRKYNRIKSTSGYYHPKFECLDKPKLTFNTFWKIGISDKSAKFSLRMLKLNVMSFLATQNLHCSRLVIWKLASFPRELESEIIDTFAEYIQNDLVEMREFDVELMCRRGAINEPYSHFYKSGICLEALEKGTSPSLGFLLSSVSLSDFLRFMVLDFDGGGIYTDGDVIFLKDMRVLLGERNFCYRWSNMDYYNTAILGIYIYIYIYVFFEFNLQWGSVMS